MKFQTHFANHPEPEIRFEKKSSLPSMTIPDQSLTVQELFRRNAKGLALGGNIHSEYDSDEKGQIDFDDFLPNTDRMDLADRQEFMEKAKEHLDEVKKKLNALASAREKQRKQRELEFKEMKEYQSQQKQKGNKLDVPPEAAFPKS